MAPRIEIRGRTCKEYSICDSRAKLHSIVRRLCVTRWAETNNRGDVAGEMADSLQTVNLGAGRTAQAITTGYEHTCAILDNSQVECLGCANYCRIYALITSLVVASASCSACVAFEVSEICRVALSVPTVGMRILTCVSLHCLRNSP